VKSFFLKAGVLLVMLISAVTSCGASYTERPLADHQWCYWDKQGVVIGWPQTWVSCGGRL